MPIARYCPNCGAKAEEGIRFCSQCGTDLEQYNTSPMSTNSNPTDTAWPEDKRAIDHLIIGYKVALENPMVFLPSIISGSLGLIVSYSLELTGYTLAILLGLGISIISFILNFASVDMSRDAYYKQLLSLIDSINYVADRFVTFFIAAIFGGLLSITIILIPVVLFMFVIMVMDETGIMDAFQKAINVLRSDLADVVIIIIASIIASVLIDYIPLVSTLLNTIVNVIIGIAFIDIYATYRAK
jgi:hypothetical protein